MPRSLDDIPGWFFWMDQLMFNRLLDAQAGTPPGHLVELGCFLGKSTVAIGAHRRDGERFVVVDLFEHTDLVDPDDIRNRRESARSYGSLTQQAFEQNYRALRDELPEVVVGMSSTVGDHLPAGSVRFLHVDASHLYEAVRGDAETAQQLLRPGGLVVFDDFRSQHTPGTAAAVWEAVVSGGLIPVVLTPSKLYAVYSNPEPYQAAVEALTADDDRITFERHQIAGHWLIRVDESKMAKERRQAKREAADAARTAKQEAARERQVSEAVEAALAEEQRRRSARTRERAGAQRPRKDTTGPAEPTTVGGRVRRRVARDLAPPILVRWVRQQRRPVNGRVPPAI